ncbi:NAD(P)-binding protein [Ascobolus immersus RN42]|uniref:NAD(P)-binding protein n=1 Tax=Ascobolus immersus RN42 TaxID=1160509 RepID=A0A3N4IM68_ASCIM|nr:NAD(P)-binding protein [Ascobolus immersus RN42]
MASLTATIIPRILVIGAGSRGNAYSMPIHYPAPGVDPIARIVGVAEPDAGKRRRFCEKYDVDPSDGLVFEDWRDLVTGVGMEKVLQGVDGIIVATLDDMHTEASPVFVLLAIRPLNKHILTEKPLAPTLEECKQIHNAFNDPNMPPVVFSIGHVLRYSPHNLLLKKLICEDQILGELISIDHTEPVGWYHFAHSYVRGNWRNTATSAPSLLTKCCHDVDVLLWFLMHPHKSIAKPHAVRDRTHYPDSVSSHGSLTHFKRSRKPIEAGNATNCFSCPAEPICIYSAKNIYLKINAGNTRWPNKILAPDIEDCGSWSEASTILTKALTNPTPPTETSPPNYGHCVYENSNDVVDNQTVTISWLSEDDADGRELPGFGAKTATLHMIASTQSICERRSRIYGSIGEIYADSHRITHHDFTTGKTHVYNPGELDIGDGGGHGGGDSGLAYAFVSAIKDVLAGGDLKTAQWKWLGTDSTEAWLAHRTVFWADQARLEKRVLGWNEGVGSE